MDNIKKTSIIGVSIIGLMLVFNAINSHIKMKKYGVYTMAKPTKWEAAEQGSTLFLKVFYGGKWYNTHMDGGYGIEIDSLYYVKILSTDPKVVDDIYTKVPQCISIVSMPPNGWSEIPTCTSSDLTDE